MDQNAEPSAPRAFQESQESGLPLRRGLARVFNEKLALWGSIIILCGWALGFLSLFVADAVEEPASALFGFFGIFAFIGLCFATPVLAPLFAFLGFKSLSSDEPSSRRRTAFFALVLAILSIVPIVVYFGPKFMF
ncbi:hypothetical protein [Corynebacterium hesseae]|uniref:hypothetical protein n=1 Tax=Corynebacterium hesseae TaxID=2913502 RepID=UPI0011A81A11|nr:hypothetical protein [Corynebacterium aurimucosum]